MKHDLCKLGLQRQSKSEQHAKDYKKLLAEKAKVLED
jgi:hypothetical protein